MKWALYFERITNEDEHSRLKATGMAWELFPDYCDTWHQHLKLKTMWDDCDDEQTFIALLGAYGVAV